jgi:hypothetical protein
MQNTQTIHELRQRIADYERLRRMATDKRALGAIDSLIGEVEERIRLNQRLLQLESASQIECERDPERDQ